jgi:ABC-2 type transport system permease protein
MLGGVFFPAPLGDGILATLSYATPHRWFMTGLGDLAGGGGVAVVLPSAGALLAFGLVTGVIAGFRLRRRVLA